MSSVFATLQVGAGSWTFWDLRPKTGFFCKAAVMAMYALLAALIRDTVAQLRLSTG